MINILDKVLLKFIYFFIVFRSDKLDMYKTGVGIPNITKCVLEKFELIMENPELRNLFFYTPLIAAMAGNVGVQSSAIIVQGLANDDVKGSINKRFYIELD